MRHVHVHRCYSNSTSRRGAATLREQRLHVFRSALPEAIQESRAAFDQANTVYKFSAMKAGGKNFCV